MARWRYYAVLLLLVVLTLLSSTDAPQFAHSDLSLHELSAGSSVGNSSARSGPVFAKKVLPTVRVKVRYLGGECSFYQPTIHQSVNCQAFAEVSVTLRNSFFITRQALRQSALRGPPAALVI